MNHKFTSDQTLDLERFYQDHIVPLSKSRRRIPWKSFLERKNMTNYPKIMGFKQGSIRQWVDRRLRKDGIKKNYPSRAQKNHKPAQKACKKPKASMTLRHFPQSCPWCSQNLKPIIAAMNL